MILVKEKNLTENFILKIMNFRNIKQASNYEVRRWLIKELKLNDYQIQKLNRENIIENGHFYIFEDKKYQSNIWLRLSIVFYPIVWLLLFIGLPINYIVTGRWGYNRKWNFIINWIDKIS